MSGEAVGGALGSGVITAWLWELLRVQYPKLPEMPASVSPAIGGALWLAYQQLVAAF